MIPAANEGNAYPGMAIPQPGGFIGIHNEHYDFMHPDTFPYTSGEIIIYLADYYLGIPLESGTWKITMDSGTGIWNTYLFSSSTTYYSYIKDYDNEGTINEPGNAECVITVGSYNSKNSWLDVNSTIQNYNYFPLGDTSYYSSQGPTRDGREKPDILAPGSMIASSVSESFIHGPVFVTKYNSDLLAYDSCHYHRSGTSFAAPHIAGLVALMFQVDPNLTCIDILDCLQSTASGYGHVNAVEALRCVGADWYCRGRCGDTNCDGVVNVSDCVKIINYVFIGGAAPCPILSCGDANSDGVVDISDAMIIINYVYVGGPPPTDCDPGSWVGQGGNCCQF